MKHKYVIFDLDGTLSDSENSIITTLKQTFSHLGISEPPYETLRRFIGPPLTDSFMRYCGLSDRQAVDARYVYQEYFDVTGKELNVLYDGAEDLLQYLKKQGRKLYVATTKEEKASLYILRKLGVSHYFERIVGASKDNSLCGKGALLKKLIGLENIDVSSAVIIGDTVYDVKGAEEAGIDCVAVLYGFNTAQQLLDSGAKVLAADIPSLKKIFS